MKEVLEVTCPKCWDNMKEWVLYHKCRSPTCNFVVQKVFPPTSSNSDLAKCLRLARRLQVELGSSLDAKYIADIIQNHFA